MKIWEKATTCRFNEWDKLACQQCLTKCLSSKKHANNPFYDHMIGFGWVCQIPDVLQQHYGSTYLTHAYPKGSVSILQKKNL